MSDEINCPYCKSNDVKSYTPGPDDGQSGYWPKWECNNCHRTWDKR